MPSEINHRIISSESNTQTIYITEVILGHSKSGLPFGLGEK